MFVSETFFEGGWFWKSKDYGGYWLKFRAGGKFRDEHISDWYCEESAQFTCKIMRRRKFRKIVSLLLKYFCIANFGDYFFNSLNQCAAWHIGVRAYYLLCIFCDKSMKEFFDESRCQLTHSTSFILSVFREVRNEKMRLYRRENMLPFFIYIWGHIRKVLLENPHVIRWK